MYTDHNTQPTARKLVWIPLLIVCIIAFLVGGAFLLRAMQDRSRQESIPQPLNGPQSLLPSLTVAQDLMHTYEDTAMLDEIEGNTFEYDMSVLEEPDYDASVSTYMNASGKIGSTAYWDTELDILYLDYGVASAGCLTYLSLDSTQTGDAAVPLTGLITAGNSIHSISYPYDDAPAYITVVGMICINDEYYYFAELHQQALNVISGTTQELAQMGVGDTTLMDPADAPFVALDGIWIAAAQPTIADDEDHSYFTSAGYYRFSPDGNFSFHPLTLGKKGTWYHVGGGDDSYEGTYHYTGSVIILQYTTHNESYFDEQLGNEVTRPVEFSETEQFTLQINQSCASMCAVIPDHPRFGKTLIFEKSKSDDPIHALLIAINSIP